MKFRPWINGHNKTELAYRLRVTPQSVILWSKGRNLPRGPIMIKLVRMGRGAFDFGDIVRECSKAQR